jgi:hypothetical protein
VDRDLWTLESSLDLDRWSVVYYLGGFGQVTQLLHVTWGADGNPSTTVLNHSTMTGPRVVICR